MAESSAFTARFAGCTETVLACLYNEPYVAGEPVPTLVWNQGEYDRLCIIPRYVGARVEAFPVTMNEDGSLEIAAQSAFSAVAEDGCIIAAALDRGEGMPLWYLSVTDPEGEAHGMYLQYNGRYGTPCYEFIENPLAAPDTDAQAEKDLAPLLELFPAEEIWAFRRAAARQGLDIWQAGSRYATEFTEIGDGAAFTKRWGEAENGVYTLQAARFRDSYYQEQDTLAQETEAQYRRYQQIGNQDGILGPETEGEEDLYFTLTGLAVFNPSLQASRVSVTVNGEAAGEFDLDGSDFCTLLPLELPHLPADVPVSVEIRVLETRFGTPAQTILEVLPGIGGNISGGL